jgi:hypothetical protein
MSEKECESDQAVMRPPSEKFGLERTSLRKEQRNFCQKQRIDFI